jgi:hypothetical protein
MLATRRWRDWQSGEISQKGPEWEPAKPSEIPDAGFLQVLKVPFERVSRKCNALDAAPAHDPAEWRAPFARWMDSVCAFHPRCSGGLNVLHSAYSDWELAHDGVPPTRDIFVALLMERGFRITVIHGTALVEGLALCMDVDLYFLQSTARMAASGPKRSAA